ncbi:hypothetical protein [Streptomyces sp. NPDC002855]|uniref:hypothetical protein n=1 Tax=Streptomyces sp. NPDC002855 TaxID=3154437 RepID=UPI00331AB401
MTAAQLNEQLRDNMLETMPAKALEQHGFFTTLSENKIVARTSGKSHRVNTSQNTTSTSYTDLGTAGPSVTVETGSTAFVFISGRVSNSGLASSTYMSFQVTGATTDTSSATMDDRALILDGVAANSGWRIGTWDLLKNLVPGENTFTAKYKVGSGTGTFYYRQIAVWPL